MSIEFYWVAVAAVTVISAARLTRLATVDKFPPVRWVRNKYLDATDNTGWDWLFLCGYCFSFWAAAFVVAWGWIAGVYSPRADTGWLALLWWLLNGTLAASYLAAITMAHDGDDNDDGEDV